MSFLIKKFRLFSPNGLIHGYSTRLGGVSSTPYDSLNLGKNTNDNPADVDKNRSIFFNALNIDISRCVFPQQVHSDVVVTVDRPGIVEKCDALITREKNLFLTIQTADCFPIFLYDNLNEIVAIVHSGWRGTAKNIVKKTIKQMAANPLHIRAAIGPGVQQSCYQVDEKTAAHFNRKYLIPDGNTHFKLDIQDAIYDQIIAAGVIRENIATDTSCTHCRSDLYYSYRRDGENSGRMMSVIGMCDR